MVSKEWNGGVCINVCVCVCVCVSRTDSSVINDAQYCTVEQYFAQLNGCGMDMGTGTARNGVDSAPAQGQC